MVRGRVVWFLVRIALAVAFITLALLFLDFKDLVDAARQLSWRALLWSLAFNVLTVVILAVRWFVMVRRIVPGSFWWHTRHYWASILFNVFTPAALGSDVYRILLLKGADQRGFSLFGLIVQERLIGLMGQAVFYLVCFAWLVAGMGVAVEEVPHQILTVADWVLAATVLGCLAAIWVGGATLSFVARHVEEPWRTRIGKTADGLQPLSLARLGLLLAITLGSVLTWSVAVWVLALDLTGSITLAEVGVVGVLGEIVRWLPISLQGIGAREVTYAFGFEILGHAKEAGFLTGGIAYLLNSVVLFLFGSITISFGWRRDSVT